MYATPVLGTQPPFLPTGLAGQFTTGNGTSTGNESIVFDGNGNLFVGHADGGKKLEMWSRSLVPHSNPPDYRYQFVAQWPPMVENRGVDWIDIRTDQVNQQTVTTIYYTSEGRKIFTFNTTSGTQGPLFADLGQPGLPNYTLFAVRILTDGRGDVLVADKKNIKRVKAGGSVVKTYDASGQDDWEALSLDPNGSSFWAGDATTQVLPV
jgi:hypothetical protein